MTGEHRDAAPTESDSDMPVRGSMAPGHIAGEPGLAAGLQPANPAPPPASPSVASSHAAAPLSPKGAARAEGSDDPGAERAESEAAGRGVRSLALLFDTDLFFSVKVTDTLKHVGYATKTLRRPEDFAAALVSEQPTLALVNTGARGLDWRGGIAAAVAAGVPVIAFGSHVDLATQQEARDLGATSVIANSKLASDLPGVVTRALKRTSPRQE